MKSYSQLPFSGLIFNSFLLISLFFLYSCTVFQEISLPKNEGLKRAGISVDELIGQVNTHQQPEAITGRARVQVSTPDETERLTVLFTATENQYIMQFRNSLGMEAGRILVTKDSVLIYDRIDGYAQIMDRETGGIFFFHRLTELDILSLIFPRLDSDFRPQVYENDVFFVLISQQGDRYYVGKSDLTIQRIVKNEYWSDFRFSGQQSDRDFTYPIRAQVLSSDQKSNIFIQIQSLQANPPNPSFSMNIPDHITVERL